MGKERLTELDKQFASMTKEQAKGIAMAISDMMKKPTDKKPRVKNESNDSKPTEKTPSVYDELLSLSSGR